MFKQIFYEDKPTQYIICDDGVIYNTKTHKNLYGSKSNGYVYVQLTIDGNPKSFALHRLIAEYFIPNPENKEVVHHIDGNNYNNSLNNLMWLTQEENSKIKICTIPRIESVVPEFTEEELAHEEWRKFKETHYEVSNLGRYKNTLTNRIYIGSQNKNNHYIRWNLGGCEFQAHRAVYETFHPDERVNIINHIDGNRANNRLSNLENVTQSENVTKSFYETKTRKTIKVACYNQEGQLIEVFPSMAACARELGCANTSTVHNALLSNYSCKGYKLEEVDTDFYQKYKTGKIDVT